MNAANQPLAIVTGGARGIGKSIASTLLSYDWAVVVADIDEQTGQETVAELGDGARFALLDVREESSWQALLGQLEQDGISVRAVVNNAGSGDSASVEDAGFEDWQRVINLNAGGVFLGCKYAVKAMQQHGGSIINIASALGKKALSSTCVYSASKAAVISLTESTALHCAEQGYPVRCNAVLPGFVDTPLLREALQLSDDPDGMLAGYVGLHPVKRLGGTDEVAEAVAFLAGDKCNFMTGASMSIDGGLTI